MSDQPEMLFTDVESHPMWRPPQGGGLSTVRIMLLRELATRLTPFDGKPGYAEVLDFAQGVYLIATHPAPGDLDVHVWLFGHVTWQRIQATQSMRNRIKVMDRRNVHVARLENNVAVVERMAEQLIQAIAGL